MTTYAVTGTTGHLGPLVVRELLARGVPAADVVALARTPEKAADLGVPVRRADYSDTATLPEALAGVDVLLLVSGSEVGRRVAQHTAVIEAAKTAGVQRVAYTSIANADHSTNPLQPEHKATEDVLRASGLPFTIFRDNWYLENYTGAAPAVPRDGRGARDRRRRPDRRGDPRGHGGGDHRRAPRRGHGRRDVRALRPAHHARRAGRGGHGRHGHQGRLPRRHARRS